MNEWEKVKEIGGRAIALAENFDIDKDSDPPLRATALEDYSDLMGAGLRAIIAAGYAIFKVANCDAVEEIRPEGEGCESGD